jgi:hypothetical protein
MNCLDFRKGLVPGAVLGPMVAIPEPPTDVLILILPVSLFLWGTNRRAL